MLTIDEIKINHDILNEIYRTGQLESELGNFVISTNENLTERLDERYDHDPFYLRPGDMGRGAKKATPISIQRANDIFFAQIDEFDKAINELRILSDPKQMATLHEAKLLAYELSDYFADADKKLSDYFVAEARLLTEPIRAKQGIDDYIVRKFSLEMDNAARLIDNKFIISQRKRVLLGALMGVNALYRSRSEMAHGEAAEHAKTVVEYIESWSKEHQPRSLLGLGYYLIGKVKFADAEYDEAQDAFKKSLRYYTQRVIVNDRLHDEGKIEDWELHQKQQLALRRASLVSGLGLAYLHKISSRLDEAEQALILPRAVSRQNSGLSHSLYIDFIYHSMMRARHSSDADQMDVVITGLRNCMESYMKYYPKKNYGYRVRTELALAIHYRLQIKNDRRIASEKERTKLYAEIEDLLKQVCDFGGPGKGETHPRHPRLLAEALHIRSNIQRINDPSNIEKAMADAEQSYRLTLGENGRGKLKYLEADAVIALASCHLTRAEQHATLKENQAGQYQSDLRLANEYLHKALSVSGLNNRLLAICYLKLAKLFSLRPETRGYAKDYYTKFKEIEPTIEHAFVIENAREIEKELASFEDYFLVPPYEKSIDFDKIRNDLYDFIINLALTRLVVKRHMELTAKNANLKQIIAEHLSEELQISKTRAYNEVSRKNFESRTRKLLQQFNAEKD